MDIRQLNYFVVIAEEGNITKAADRLFMAQPPLSRQLKLMEKELGVVLFDRTNKKNIVITPEGRVFLENARKILNSVKESITEVQEFSQHMTERLSIGTTIYCLEIMLPVLKIFRQNYPAVTPEIHEGSISYITNLLKNHTIELALFPNPFNTDGYKTKELPSDTCVFVVSKNFEWEEECISLEEISQIPLLLLNTSDSNSLYQRILDEFEKRNLKLNISCVCHDSGLLIKMILNNLGATIVPNSMVNDVLSKFMRVIPIKNDPWISTPNLIWHSEGYMSSTLKEFIKSFESYYSLNP